MSIIDFEFLDASTGQAWKTGMMRPCPLTLLGPFTITSATPGLTTGVPLTKLPVGAVIYDVGIFVTTGWDGTTPKMDVGAFSGNTGLFSNLADGGVVELGDQIGTITDNTGLQSNQDSQSWLAAAIASVGAAGGSAFLPPEVYVNAITTLSAVVSQSGAKGGSSAGSSTGTALVYVLVSTPSVS